MDQSGSILGQGMRVTRSKSAARRISIVSYILHGQEPIRLHKQAQVFLECLMKLWYWPPTIDLLNTLKKVLYLERTQYQYLRCVRRHGYPMIGEDNLQG